MDPKGCKYEGKEYADGGKRVGRRQEVRWKRGEAGRGKGTYE